MKNSTVKTYFLVADFSISTDEVSKILCLKPSDCANKAEIKNNQIGEPFKVINSYWELSLSTDTDPDLENYIINLIDILKERSSNINNLQKIAPNSELNIMLNVTIKPNCSFPGLLLSPKHMKFLVEHNINLVIDFM
ncbi:DUF4279 domain-containing protein [Zooshikella ganghwensis]|nr:DUF4279 domain-containing protein [Zooshikella ganghwensis]